jgi:hypothetical protein
MNFPLTLHDKIMFWEYVFLVVHSWSESRKVVRNTGKEDSFYQYAALGV